MERQEIAGKAPIVVNALDNPVELRKAVSPMNSFVREDSPIELRLDKDGVILYANPAGELLLHSWGSEIGGSMQDDKVNKYAPRLLQDAAYDVFMSQLSKSIEVESGEVIYWFFIMPIPDVGYVNLYGIDITQRKRAETALKGLAKNYRKLFDEIMDAIFVSDATTGIIVDCNQAASKLIGVPRSKLIGMHQRLLHPPEENVSELNRILELRGINEKGTTFEAPVITKNGEIRYILVKADVLNVNGRKMLQSIFRDITEQKQMKKRLTELTYTTDDFSPGGCFVAESHERCFAAYTDLIFHGVPSLCITRENPTKIVEQYGIKPETVKLLSSKPYKDFEALRDLQSVSLTISWFLKANKSGIVLLDGLEYLVTRFGFEAVYSFIQEKRFDFLEAGAVLLMPVNMSTLGEKEKALLIIETKVLGDKSI